MNKAVAVVVLLIATITVGTSAASAQQKSGACVPHSTATTAHELVYDEIIDMSIYPVEIWDLIVADIGATIDKNGDGIVCSRTGHEPRAGREVVWRGRVPVTDYVATFVTDNNAVGLLRFNPGPLGSPEP